MYVEFIRPSIIADIRVLHFRLFCLFICFGLSFLQKLNRLFLPCSRDGLKIQGGCFFPKNLGRGSMILWNFFKGVLPFSVLLPFLPGMPCFYPPPPSCICLFCLMSLFSQFCPGTNGSAAREWENYADSKLRILKPNIERVLW